MNIYPRVLFFILFFLTHGDMRQKESKVRRRVFSSPFLPSFICVYFSLFLSARVSVCAYFNQNKLLTRFFL
ncbi:hypothetical protein BDF21DRAFT_429244 [Thamnidium elegans]|nr:hypothetical protein BDF21DRAFT_429244 [Thamnidium elegans]